MSNTIYKINVKKLLGRLMGLMAAVILMAGCSDDPADPPVIKVFVNGNEVTASSEPLAVVIGDQVAYRFEITAFATIADIKALKYDILNDVVKAPTEQLVGGLTQTRHEIVEGVLNVGATNVEFAIVVKDMDGNEVSKSFTYVVQQ